MVAWRRDYREQPDVKAKNKEYQRKYSKKRYRDPVNHAKAVARRCVAEAVRTGRLIKPATCQAGGKYGNRCIGTPFQAHHYKGYAQEHWLDVEWLCRGCARAADMAQKDDGSASEPPVADWQHILDLYGNRCAYCGNPFTADNPATEDHVIPLISGGDHSTENTVPACFSCNAEKHDRILRKPEPGQPASIAALVAELEDPPPNVVCVHCRHTKPQTTDYFRGECRGGWRDICRECEKIVIRCGGLCHRIKPVEEFSPDKTMDTGRKSWCRTCSHRSQAVSRSTGAFREKRKAYRQQEHVRAKTASYNKNYQGAKVKVEVTEKNCTNCELVKPASEFSKNSKTSTGLASWCKACVAAKTAAIRARVQLAAPTMIS